ncbi:uncharacterized protein BDZ99DRAFT_575165 [Mytilinidion resinicola]|uniref:Zn(2)-C6 fungal-type domain-containing protein n=1 Tax=Mytilinidion resinicola TaxID=574789 RepID=A0A6A6YAG5_9PEZI|nr:uncharacterized protein BDZ99DRAFT_575165 [Mytilinidion resinicola]KAF2804994.1 hypothetical protein BDZ99DRAFT_575165 [Mytilinidion resinicola]
MPAQTSSSTTTATRVRASLACQTCRQRKVKCDVQKLDPGRPCTPCQQSETNCVVHEDRRKWTSRAHIETLRERIRNLETLLGNPPVQNGRSGDTADENYTQAAHLARPSNGANATVMSPPNASAPQSTCDHGYGPFSPNVQQQISPPGNHWLDSLPDEPAPPGIALDKNSAQLRYHLLQSYFKYQPLWVFLVDKKTFMKHRAIGSPSQWYSKFLESVLLACAARHSTSHAVRALRHEYAKQAQADIPSALENPTPASLEGFLLFSEYEVTLGHNGMGWMLCGMACRTIYSLDLHQIPDTPTGCNREKHSSPSESTLLHSLLCACIMYEGIWCTYLGRPSSIPKAVMNIATTWCHNRKEPASTMVTAWVGLCVPMAEITETLNKPSATHTTTAATLVELDTKLRTWYDNLPPGIAYDDAHMAELDATAYGLHMQYCKLRILIQQAAIRNSASRKRKFGEIEPSSPPSQEFPKQIIYQNALRIARLLLTYREIFGTENIPSVMLDNARLGMECLVSHILEHPGPNTSREEDMKWLRQMVRTMEAVQFHFPITKSMLIGLEESVEGTSLASLFSSPSPQTPSAPQNSPPYAPEHRESAVVVSEQENAVVVADQERMENDDGWIGTASDILSSFGFPIDLNSANTEDADNHFALDKLANNNRRALHDPSDPVNSFSWPEFQLETLSPDLSMLRSVW